MSGQTRVKTICLYVFQVKMVILFPYFSEIMIVSQPKSCIVSFGGDALFHCEAKCNAPLQYKWFKDGKPMEGKHMPVG